MHGHGDPEVRHFLLESVTERISAERSDKTRLRIDLGEKRGNVRGTSSPAASDGGRRIGTDGDGRCQPDDDVFDEVAETDDHRRSNRATTST